MIWGYPYFRKPAYVCLQMIPRDKTDGGAPLKDSLPPPSRNKWAELWLSGLPAYINQPLELVLAPREIPKVDPRALMYYTLYHHILMSDQST